MNPLQRYVLAIARVLVALIFLLNGLGIISQAQPAKEMIEHGAPRHRGALSHGKRESPGSGCRPWTRFRHLPATGSCGIVGFPDSRDARGARLLAGSRHGLLYGAPSQFLKEHSHGRWLVVYRGRNLSQPCFRELRGQTVENEPEMGALHAIPKSYLK